MSLLSKYIVALLTTSCTLFVLAIFVYFKGRKRSVNKAFAFYSLCIAIWSLGQAYHIGATDRLTAIFWARFFHAGVIFISTGFVHFTLALLGLDTVKRKVIRNLYIASFVFLFFDFTHFFIPDAVPKFSLNYYWTIGPVYPVFLLYWFGSIVYALQKLYVAYRSALGMKRNQLKLLFWATLIGYFGGSSNYLPAFNIYLYPFTPFGTYTVPVYSFVVAYAIIRYRLLDITVYATRFAVFTLIFFGVTFSALGITSFSRRFLTQKLGDGWWYLPLIGSMLLAAVAYALGIQVIRTMDKKRLAKIQEAQEALEHSGRGMIEISNIHKLAKIIPRYLVKLYHLKLSTVIEHVTIFLFDRKTQKFILESSAGSKKLNEGITLTISHPFCVWFTEKRKLFIQRNVAPRKDIDALRLEDIDYWTHNGRALAADSALPNLLAHMKEEMRRFGSVICVPSIYRDELMGFLLLGNKSVGIYNEEELDIFSRLATNAAAAFRGAQLAYRLKEIQADLITSERLAAIGRLATSAKHEINNPLNMIYGSFQHVLADMADVKHGYQKLKIRLIGMIDGAKALGAELAVSDEARLGMKFRELNTKLFVLDDAFASLDRRGKPDKEFYEELDKHIDFINNVRAAYDVLKDDANFESTVDGIERISLSLETMSRILDKVKNIDDTLYNSINDGFENAKRIAKVVDAIYHLPKDKDKDLKPILVGDIVKKSFEFVRYQTYWENLTDTTKVFDIPSDLPKIRAYENKLVSVFSNLIINAYQAMTGAGISDTKERVVKVTACRALDNPAFVEVRIANKGPLIPEEYLSRIFDEGYTTKEKGSGLGLYICKILIETFNNGSIYARNVPEFGPEFVLRIPAWVEEAVHDNKNPGS